MKFDIRQKGRKSDRDNFFKRLLESPAIMASGISTIFLSSDPDELCDRLKLLLQETQAANSSDIINNEIVAIVDKISKHKCISMKQHKKFLNNCNLILEYMYTQIYLYVYNFYI